MNSNRHRAGSVVRLAAIAIGIALLASCSSSEDSTAVAVTTADSAGYTIVAGDTLSGIAARAGVSIADLVAANGWTDGDAHLIVPGDVIKLPLGSSPVPPKSASSTTAAPTPEPGSTAAPAAVGYQLIADPHFDSLRVNQKSDPIIDPLPDGQYWSWDYTSDGENVSFTLVQYFFGDACRAQFGDDCASDNNTLYSPSATVGLADNAATSVVACCGDGSQIKSYRVSTKEFARVAAGRASAADAPADFAYVPFGVMVTVRNGQAIAADQVFTS